MYEPPSVSPPPRPRPRLSEIIAWLVIGTIVGVILGLPYLGPPTGIPQGESNIELRIIGRYLVGAKVLVPGMTAARNGQDQFQTMVLEAARTPTDHLRAIAIIAEIIGKDSALKLLDDFQKSDPSEELARDADLLRKIYRDNPDTLTADQRARLIERHEWFGQLALSTGRSDDDSMRKAVLLPARRTMATLLLVVLGGVVAFLAGLGLLIFFIVKFAT